MAVLRDKALQQLPVELTNSWISIVDERKFNADVGAQHPFQLSSMTFAACGSDIPTASFDGALLSMSCISYRHSSR